MRVIAPLGLGGVLLLGCAGSEQAHEREAEPPVAAAASAEPAPAERRVASEPAPAPNAAPASTAAGAPFDARWVDEVQAVVAAFEAWGRVDDEMRWAPWLCRMPMAARARVSESDDGDTHGQKLYTLYAMDPEAYGAPASGTGAPSRLAGLSQVIVKESFAPVPLEPAESGGARSGLGVGEHRLQPAEKDGHHFVAGERKGLYVMMKVEGAAQGTDAGWVYATVAPDMATVTAVGVIESCAGCHAEAGDDRLFGLPGLAAAPSPSPRPARANAVPL